MAPDSDFVNHMNRNELNVLSSFEDVVNNFLISHKESSYRELVKKTPSAVREHCPKMNNKVHFPFSHLERFPDNLGVYSEEQRDRFHQVIKIVEERY